MLKQGVSKQGVTTFAGRPGSQYDVAATRGADSALASDCRAQFGRPSTRRGCRICVTVRLPVRPRGETMYWQTSSIAVEEAVEHRNLYGTFVSRLS